MNDVVENISFLPEEDVYALAAYVLSLNEDVTHDGNGIAARTFAETVARSISAMQSAETESGIAPGLMVLRERFENCHRYGTDAVPLGLVKAFWGPVPDNFLRVVAGGVAPTENAYFVRPMLSFPDLSDEELRDLAVFVRNTFSTVPPWTGIEAAIATAAASNLVGSR